MKKLLITLAFVLLISPVANAAVIISDYANRMAQNYVEQIAPITITAESEGEITTENGISLSVDAYKYILWNAVDTVTATGTAVEQGLIDETIIPEYSESYKTVHIPIKSDFDVGDSFVLSGLELRSYDREFSSRFIEVDLNGDLFTDVVDLNGYKVTSSVRTDNTPPYPVYNVEYVINENMDQLDITWTNPPDYDLVHVFVERVLTRDGAEQVPNALFESGYTDNVTDNDIQLGDEIVYTIFAKDNRNNGETYELTVLVEEPTPAEEPIEEPVEQPPLSGEETELEELDRLFNYYQIRYNIKCLPSGIPAPESSSTCLWARIDLVYAQSLLERSDVDVGITDRDIELMAKRVQYPEARYQDNCVDADEPASNCSALGKALERIHYFID